MHLTLATAHVLQQCRTSFERNVVLDVAILQRMLTNLLSATLWDESERCPSVGGRHALRHISVLRADDCGSYNLGLHLGGIWLPELNINRIAYATSVTAGLCNFFAWETPSLALVFCKYQPMAEEGSVRTTPARFRALL